MFIIKNKIFFRIIILLVLAAFTGCVTSRIEMVASEKLPIKKTYRIRTIYLRDDRAIDVKDKEAKLKLNYKDKGNVIIYYEKVNEEKLILLGNIAHLEIEVHESNKVVNVILIVGSVVLFFTLLYLLLRPLGKFKAG